MKKIIGIIFVLLGVFGGLYMSVDGLFIKPIIDACVAFDNGTLSGLIVGTTFLKCLFAGLVGWFIYFVGFVIGRKLITNE